MQTKIASIMSQKMDRTKFLQYAGGVALTVIGLRGLIASLSENNNAAHRTRGYGTTRYGS